LDIELSFKTVNIYHDFARAGSILGSVLLLKGLITKFTFFAMMSTLAVLVLLLFSADADLKYSWKSSKGCAGIAGLAFIYSMGVSPFISRTSRLLGNEKPS